MRENMYYFAKFEKINGYLFRFDTRIYLVSYQDGTESQCIGAIVAKNPGSAIYKKLGKWSSLDLNGDKMLPTVRNRFINACAHAEKNIPINSFVRVWNLFYLCDPNLGEACRSINTFNLIPECASETDNVNIVWYAWGDDDKFLNKFKNRFLNRRQNNGFYYNKRNGSISEHSPDLSDFAKHTQGMPAEPVEHYLKSKLFK